MRQFSVYVSREECQYILVSADNEEEAEDLAIQTAMEMAWNEAPHFEVLATEEERNGYKKEGKDSEEDECEEDEREEDEREEDEREED